LILNGPLRVGPVARGAMPSVRQRSNVRRPMFSSAHTWSTVNRSSAAAEARRCLPRLPRRRLLAGQAS
jgi:hypothetical protein